MLQLLGIEPGSEPTTNKGKTNPSGLAFFAYYRVFALVRERVLADYGESHFGQ